MIELSGKNKKVNRLIVYKGLYLTISAFIIAYCQMSLFVCSEKEKIYWKVYISPQTTPFISTIIEVPQAKHVIKYEKFQDISDWKCCKIFVNSIFIQLFNGKDCILDKLIFNKKYSKVDFKMIYSNVRGRKETNIRDKLFVLNASINSIKWKCRSMSYKCQWCEKQPGYTLWENKICINCMEMNKLKQTPPKSLKKYRLKESLGNVSHLMFIKKWQKSQTQKSILVTLYQPKAH